MARARRPGALPAALLVLGVVLAACTVGPSQRPPVAVRGENMPAPPPGPGAAAPPLDVLPEPGPQNANIPFVDCTGEVLATLVPPPPPDRALRIECGELTVPADPTRPGIGGVALGVLRVGLADAPDDRPPLLAVGDSAGEPSARHAVVLAGQVSPALLERYTLIGLDRRGTGLDGLSCSPTFARAALVDADPAATTEADLSALLERARAVVQECNLVLDDGLGAYRSSTTAADVEYLRGALGVERLSAVGVGDGAAALTTWARTVPRAVGRLVLDGPPQPGIDEPALGESRAATAEAAFGAFAVACAARPDCPLGADPRAAVTAVLDSLRARPLLSVDGRRLTAGAATTALLSGLGEPRSWPALAAALAAAGAGDPTAVLDLLEPLVGPLGGFDARLATACNDTRRRASPAEAAALAERLRAEYPLFGGTAAVRQIACAPWSTGGPTPEAGTAEDAPPILVIGTAADPRSSLEGARLAAEALPSGRFLSWQGTGSGAYPRTACVSDVVDGMLVDGTVPQAGTLCPP